MDAYSSYYYYYHYYYLLIISIDPTGCQAIGYRKRHNTHIFVRVFIILKIELVQIYIKCDTGSLHFHHRLISYMITDFLKLSLSEFIPYCKEKFMSLHSEAMGSNVLCYEGSCSLWTWEIHTKFWYENLREKVSLGRSRLNVRTMWILKEMDGRVLTGYIWLRIETSGRILGTW
jgi:hypothetical protein